MKPPYEITTTILKLVSSISEKLGAVSANLLNKPSPYLRKQNQIKTIQSSLAIEGNSLNYMQVTAIIEKKRVLGKEKDIKEVLNAIEVYENLDSFNPTSSESFLKAHKILMTGLIEKPGKYRNKGVGIFKGSEVSHVGPPAENVHFLMRNLFNYLKNENELSLIKGCVFHYEMEFIHPFLDGNGRMGRLWQSIILMQEYSVFGFLPLETLISKNQKTYYKALETSDKQGKSTFFIEYMLGVINEALNELLDFNQKIFTDIDRLNYFISLGKKKFTRKDYLNIFKNISSATASRDLKKGTDLTLFEKKGDKNQAFYITH